MDASEVTRMVYARVQAMEPEAASKIMGYLLLQDDGELDMIRLAFAPDSLLQALVCKAKQQLGLVPPPPPLPLSPSAPSSRLPILPPSSSPPADFFQRDRLSAPFHHPSPVPDVLVRPSDLPPLPDPFPFLSDPPTPSSSSTLHHHHPPPSPLTIFSLPDTLSLLHSDSFLSRPTSRRPSSLSDLPLSPDASLSSAWKPCLYYARGYCKHGSNCRFLHSHVRSDPASPSFLNNGLRDSRSDDGLLPGSLERLELELHELLRGRKAPVSIASLPQLYYEKFGRTLQADGYLTESQRHGKAGYSLTKLLARLKNTVTLIDRPHGQHAVVLAEDALKFTSYRGEKDELSLVNPGSRQIYLTFPAESTFTEDDVSAHFREYGPVQDVRIPYQPKRMFGFVTFVYPETVKLILAKGNPHFICGARVLVKPYREKGKHCEKKLPDKEHSRFAQSRSFDGRDYVFSPGLQFFDDHDLLRRQINDQELQAIEFERRLFTDLQISDSSQLFVDTGAQSVEALQVQHGHSSNGVASSGELGRAAEDLTHLPASSAFGYLLDVLDGDSGEDRGAQENADNDQPSDVHNLPDSPFASPHSEVEMKPASLPDNLHSFSLGLRTLHLPGSPAAVTVNPEVDKELTCRTCKGFFVDPIRLDCSHMFCVQCILKVIRVSKDECPVCRRHIGSQIVKLLESRGLQVIEPSLTKPRSTATSQITIW